MDINNKAVNDLNELHGIDESIHVLLSIMIVNYENIFSMDLSKKDRISDLTASSVSSSITKPDPLCYIDAYVNVNDYWRVAELTALKHVLDSTRSDYLAIFLEEFSVKSDE